MKLLCQNELVFWWEAHMEGSVLNFLKAEWKVSDTRSDQCWASSSIFQQYCYVFFFAIFQQYFCLPFSIFQQYFCLLFSIFQQYLCVFFFKYFNNIYVFFFQYFNNDSHLAFFQPVKSFHKLTAAILKLNIPVCKSACDKKHYCKVSWSLE